MLSSLYKLSTWFYSKLNFIFNTRNSIPGFGFTELYKTCCEFESPGVFGGPYFDCGSCSFGENTLKIESPFIRGASYKICCKSRDELEKKIVLLNPLINPRIQLKNISINRLFRSEEKRKSLIGVDDYYIDDSGKGMVIRSKAKYGKDRSKPEKYISGNEKDILEYGRGRGITLDDSFLVNEDNTKVYCIVIDNWVYPIASSFISLNDKPDHPLIIAWCFKYLLCRPYFGEYIICRSENMLATSIDFETLLSRDFCIKQVEITKFHYEPKERPSDFRDSFMIFKQNEESENLQTLWIKDFLKAITGFFGAYMELSIYIPLVACVITLTISLNRSLVIKNHKSRH